jgi:hypothetical protein
MQKKQALESTDQNVVEEFTRPLTAEYFHVQTGFT